MEYVFGTNRNKEILKTKGSEHTDLTGYHEVVREYPDQTITDRFFVIEKYHTDEDSEGNCYDWYEIDRHYRFSDKFDGHIGETQQDITELEIETMTQAQQLTDAEIAILELQLKVG